MKKILLTFDAEEFDLPLEYGIKISEEDKYGISKKGLLSIKELLAKQNINSTFFTTASFAKKFPNLTRSLIKQNHEIACHGYNHSDSYLKDLSKIRLAKKEIELITKKTVKGFRAPRFEVKSISHLSDMGFEYDSSLHPTFIPGRYMNLNKKRKIHKIGNITEIPISVSPFFRLPMSWIFFKNLPLYYTKTITRLNRDYTLIFFHPWEFADLSKIKISNYLKRKSGNNLIKILNKYILFCKKKNYKFETIEEYLSRIVWK